MSDKDSRVTLLVTMGSMPTPEDLSFGMNALDTADDVLSTWLMLMKPHPRDGEGDPEDFWEMAYRLHAAVCAPAKEVLVSIHGGFRRVIRDKDGLSFGSAPVLTFNEGISKALDPSEPYEIYGPVSRYSPEEISAETQDSLAERYGDSDIFKRLAGREFVRCGYGDSEEPVNVDVRDVLRAMRDKGIDRAAVKSFRMKKMPLLSIDLPEGEDELIGSIDEVLLSSMTMHLIGYEGSLLAQEWVPMEYEYRVFIVKGKPVTGAGCIEEFTPMEADEDFSALMRRNRSEMSEVEAMPELRDKYVEFARAAATELAAEGRLEYVLDLATDARTGEILAIELNPLRNSGLYASRPSKVVEALVKK